MERHRHGLIIADDLALGLYVLLILFWLWTALRSYLELTDSALRVRGGFRTKDIPYNAIAGIRKPSQGPHRMNRKSIELEIARLGPETYPHEYLRFAVADRVALAREIHTRAPEAVYEF